MGPVTYRARAELRSSLRGALAIAVLITLVAGLVLAFVAGARRTLSAYPRMLDATKEADLFVSPAGGNDPAPYYRALAQVDGVARTAAVAGLDYRALDGTPTAALAAATGSPSGLGVMLSPLDDVAGVRLHRPIVTEGRLPAADSTEEVLISRITARRTGLQLGDVVHVVLPDRDVGVGPTAAAEDGHVLRLRVVGIGTFASEVITTSEIDEIGMLMVSPAVAPLQDRVLGFSGAYVELTADADIDEVGSRLSALGEDATLGTGGSVFVSDETAKADNVQAGMRPLAVALAVSAATIAVVGLVIVAQALTRHTASGLTESVTLRSLGFTTGQRLLVPLERALVIGVIGAMGAVAVAVLLSPRFPVGPARIAEPDPGLMVDVPVLAAGWVVTVLASVAVLVPSAVLRERRPGRGASRIGWAVTSSAGAARFRPTVVQGCRFAFGPGPEGTAPARGAVVVATIAVAAVLGTAAFARNMSDLVDEPPRYGQGWDVLVDGGFSPVAVPHLLDRIAARGDVTGVAVGNYGELSVGGIEVPSVELATVRGDAGLTMLEGGPADAAGEIVLGTEVLDRLGADVGGMVDVDVGHGVEPWRIVGRAVFPRLGRGSFDITGLGVGAQVAPGPFAEPDMEHLITVGGADPTDFRYEGGYYSFLVVEVDGDATALASDLGTVAAETGAVIRDSLAPTAIRDLDRVRHVPVALAGILTLVAAATVAHQVNESVRERRTELALLRALGFTGGQLRVVVATHAVLLAAAALVVGLPVGLALGLTVWRGYAERLYVDVPSSVPWTWVLGAIPAALLTALAVSAVPGGRSARQSLAAGSGQEGRG
jgi:ABC-type lipoprotein release transport system permease subunit